MKNNIIYKILFLVIIILPIVGCEPDTENLNSANETNVFLTKRGIIESTSALKQLYSTSVIRFNVESTSFAAKEVGASNTFSNLFEGELGGSGLPDNNIAVTGIWSSNLRVIKAANDIINATNNLVLTPANPGTKTGIIACAKLYKAMCIGNLSQNFENVVIEPSTGNNAQFVTRQNGYLRAIQLLNEIKTDVLATPISAEINSLWFVDINLNNTVQALLARYNLFAGNYNDAIVAANSVNLSIKSVFKYDSNNVNPIFARIVQANNFKPISNFGLPSSIPVNSADGRKTFYLGASAGISVGGGLYPLVSLVGFFNTNVTDIPLYLVDEMKLIKAEAHLRKSTPDLVAATLELNSVLTGTDVFGVNANLPVYSGLNAIPDLLLEIYKNRRIELFLTGMSLEDSRRFGRPTPSISGPNFIDERNRNFFPYPFIERFNNPNTPANPSI